MKARRVKRGGRRHITFAVVTGLGGWNGWNLADRIASVSHCYWCGIGSGDAVVVFVYCHTGAPGTRVMIILMIAGWMLRCHGVTVTCCVTRW